MRALQSKLTTEFIRQEVADSDVIFRRGERLFEYGACINRKADLHAGSFVYEVDGSYGDYTIEIDFKENDVETFCDCPYPGTGCKHTVAALLDIRHIMSSNRQRAAAAAPGPDAANRQTPDPQKPDPWLSREEIRAQALEDRRRRAKSEKMRIISGDMFKGEHLVETPAGKQYGVTLHDPAAGRGHCSCPDYLTSGLSTCKHLMAVTDMLKGKKNFADTVAQERFPFVDIFWDAAARRPRVFCDDPAREPEDIQAALTEFFDDTGRFYADDLCAFTPLLSLPDRHKRVRIQPMVLEKVNNAWARRQMADLEDHYEPDFSVINTRLYDYQKDGVRFALFKKAALIGDEMGLGKTLQAICASVLKRDIFGFSKVLIITLASLKEQWAREIQRFSRESAKIVAGNPDQRRQCYLGDDAFFKITNYEAVLRDVGVIRQYRPDLVILDEAQRIKNFNTKTADTVKRIPREHALVLTGTPLENKLEDVYSIVQFLEPDLLSPLWSFAADHFMLSRDQKGKILGYRNLEKLHQRLQPIVIRRKKRSVLDQLPDEIVNNYYVDLTERQAKIHLGYAQLLGPIINKKFLTPMDIRRMQELLLKMRQVCDSTYLIDRKTHISPKLKELESIISELVGDSDHKVVIFSEWTTMTYLIARQLSNSGIAFVELSGKVPVPKRQALIDEFSNNPDCRVFLSTDAGGTGLNLQAADCVINFELPWNPAKMNQRIGRVSRIGQKSSAINVVNLIAKASIEERIYAGIQMKTDLFQGVFDGTTDMVEFSREKRTELLNQLREMMQEPLLEVASDPVPAEEIPEDTPHFLNPRVLKEEKDSDRVAAAGVSSGIDTPELEPELEMDSPEPDTPEPDTPEMDTPDLIAYDKEENEDPAAPDSISPESFSPDSLLPERELTQTAASASGAGAGPAGSRDTAAPMTGPDDPEKMETVLNSGMAFISGLMEMATGRKMAPAADDGKMIQVDRTTGEVTMKFKLPGF